LARQVILATGGIGGLYPRTTNAAAATGDGLAAALRCGADVRDLEFIQFHPTALPEPDAEGRCFLISEAVRGEGGILRNKKGEAFMAREHPQADLAPRDIVARAIFRQMIQEGTDHVWLDITHRSRPFLKKRFPMIYETCARRGLDMAEQWLPVAPVHHYFMGGVRTDLDGRSSRQGLWVCGEAACTGIYGANRLASNSLLECLVFGRRIARAINQDFSDNPGRTKLTVPAEPLRIVPNNLELPAERAQAIRLLIRQLMDRYCGILRDHDGLALALEKLRQLSLELSEVAVHDRLTIETCQMVKAAEAIVHAALLRRNSIGAHYRTDDPTGKPDTVS
jgi:L-aspartate oxidase